MRLSVWPSACKVAYLPLMPRLTPAGTFEGTVMHWVTSVVVVGMGQGLAPPTKEAHRSMVES